MPVTSGLWPEIVGYHVKPGAISLWWLAQAGFVVKSPGGAVLLIDPYLSDVVARTYNQPRVVEAPLSPEEVEVDAVLATHSHDDHLDPESIASLVRSGTVLVAPPMAIEKAVAVGVPVERAVRVARGDVTQIRDVTVRAVHARHCFEPEPTPDAIGFLFTCGRVSVYHSGDSEYDPRILEDTRGLTVASLVSINGTTSNMNAYEAALLAWQQGASVAIPMHYGMWADAQYGEGATLDPELFTHTVALLSGDSMRSVIPTVGKRIDVTA